MAKVKTAAQKIREFLKAKGADADEIKDAFAELEAADVDLDQFAGKIEAWNTWYQAAAPEIQTMASERDKYKATLDAMEKAGFKLTESAPEPKKEEPAYVTAAQLKEWQNQLTGASSATMKALTKISLKHFKTFQAEPDLDAIETLMEEAKKKGKFLDVEDAYELWAKPEYTKLQEKEYQRKLDEGIKQGVKDQISKLGISAPRAKAKGDVVEQELLSKASTQKTYSKMSPEEQREYDNSLRTGFLSDINEEPAVTH